MRKRLTVLAAWCMIIISISSCRTQKIPRDEVLSFIDDYEKKAEFLQRRLAEERWQYYSDGNSDSLTYYQWAYWSYHAGSDLLSRTEKYAQAIEDPRSLRKLTLIQRRCLGAVGEADPRVISFADSLATVGRTRWTEYGGNRLSPDQVLGVVVSEPNRTKRRDAYFAYASTGEDMLSGLAALVRLRNNAVSRLGYGSYHDAMLKADDFDQVRYLQLLGDLDRLTVEPYRAVLDSMRKVLAMEDLRVWDIEYILQQTKAKAAEYARAGKQMALVDETLAGMGIILPKLPIYVDTAAGLLGPEHDKVLAVHIPCDVRVRADIIDGTASLRALFRQMGRAVYLARINQASFLFAQPPAPCFEYGMGWVMSGLTGLDAWKRKYAGMPDPLVVEQRLQRDFLKLYNVRRTLVHLYFEKALYENPAVDLNRVYSDFFERYLLIPNVPGTLPWAEIMDDIVNPMTGQNLLLGECIAAQTYQYLDQKYGSVLDNRRVFEFLTQNFYRFGGLDDWDNLVIHATGEELNPRYIILFPGD